jgi:hypothetical protein
MRCEGSCTCRLRIISVFVSPERIQNYNVLIAGGAAVCAGKLSTHGSDW